MTTPQQTPQEKGPSRSQAASSEEPIAARYVEEQLNQTRSSLNRTRIWCGIAIVLVIGYMSFATATIHNKLLRPDSAAQMATFYVVTLVEENGRELSSSLLAEVPSMISELRHTMQAQLPKYRLQVENQLEETLTVYCQEWAPILEEQLDVFLVDNQERVKLFLASAEDPEMIKELGAELEKDLLGYLHSQGPDGESAMDKLDQGLLALKNVEARLQHLAQADDLTAEEQHMRRAIGLTMKMAELVSN